MHVFQRMGCGVAAYARVPVSMVRRTLTFCQPSIHTHHRRLWGRKRGEMDFWHVVSSFSQHLRRSCCTFYLVHGLCGCGCA